MTPETLPDDWYPGVLPPNVVRGEGSSLDSTYALRRFYSRREPGLVLGAYCGVYGNSAFAVGEAGVVTIGAYSMLNGVYIRCEASVSIGERVLMAWDVGIFDTHVWPRSKDERAAALRAMRPDAMGRTPSAPARPVVIGDDVWIGFGAIVLPGVQLGARCVVGARSVVSRDVPPDCIAVGNPARVVRRA